MVKIGVISSAGIFPDTRTTQNSGVGLTELPTAPGGQMTNITPNAKMAAVGVGMVQAYPGGHRSTNLQGNWLNDPRFGVK